MLITVVAIEALTPIPITLRAAVVTEVSRILSRTARFGCLIVAVPGQQLQFIFQSFANVHFQSLLIAKSLMCLLDHRRIVA